MKSSPMSGSQWMAVLLCLTLALGAVFLSLSNVYRIKRIEREKGSVTVDLLKQQNEILRDVCTLLKSQEHRSEDVMEEVGSALEDAGAPSPPVAE